MDSENISKINLLIHQWPRGTVAVYPWLNQLGIYQQLVNTYLKSSWIEKIGRGAFILAGDKVGWEGAIYAVQNHLQLSIHPGGKTALQLMGSAHYVAMGQKYPVYLYGTSPEKLPAWFEAYDWKVRVHYSTSKLFSNQTPSLGLTERSFGPFSLKISTLERAILEVLYDVPYHVTFEESVLLMEGLQTLRPRLVQELLEVCQSVKVKRLFLHLAERSQHSWVKNLDITKVDLGGGKRMIPPGGDYDAKYQLSVPITKKEEPGA